MPGDLVPFRKPHVIFDDDLKQRYLEKLRETGLVTRSAELVGTSRSSVYRAVAEDEDFAVAFAEARAARNEELIALAEERATGYLEDLVYQGQLTGEKKKVYSERLFELLLRTRVGLTEKQQLEVDVKQPGVLVVGAPVQSSEDWAAAANQAVEADFTVEEGEANE